MSTKPTNGQPFSERGADRDWQCDTPDADGVEYLQQDAEIPEGSSPKKGTFSGGFEDPAVTRMRAMDEDRAAFVAKRRANLNPVQRMFSYVVPYGGLVSSGFNLASSSIGAGIIALPSAFQTSGLIMAIIYLVTVALLTVYSFTLLGIAGKRTGLRNYEQITRELLGVGADYWLAFCMWLLSFGAEVSYVISLGDIMAQFMDNSESTPAYLKTKSGHRLITSVLWLTCMLPLCLPKEINSLRYFSFVAIMFIIFFVICVIVHSAQNGLKHPETRGDLVMFQTGNQAVQGLSIFIFAFICQLNCYEVYAEMYQPGARRLTYAAAIGVSLCFCLYFCSGLFGYLDFGPEVGNKSALAMYNPIAEPLMGVAYVGIMLKLCVGYGLHMIPVRDAVYHVVNIDVRTIAWWKNALVCGSMAALSLLAGLLIPRITLVFGLVGGFSGGFIGFIFPALMFMYSGDWSLTTVGWLHYFSTYFLLIAGVIAVVFGTSASIFAEVVAE